jgi:drug/metabolite transporter (DMT)-like permease
VADLASDSDQSAEIARQADAGRQAMGGIGLMLVALTIVPMMDAAAKYLSDDFATVQIVWARYFFHLLFLLPVILWRYGRRAFHTRRPAMQLVRGSLLAMSTFLFFAAIAHMPLADAIATIFVYPFIVTALSPAVLGEPVGIRRWMAVLVGFVGALIVIRPTGDVLNEGVVLALAAGTGFAGYTLFTRKLAGIDPPLITLAFTGLVGAVGASLFLPFVWIAPRPEHWPLLAFIGLCAASGHFLIILAYERVRAATLAPFGYFEIVTATLLGFFIFGDFPDRITWLGIAIIVASGIYISYRERVNNQVTVQTIPKQQL